MKKLDTYKRIIILLESTQIIFIPSQIVWPLFHFGMSQNEVLFERSISKFPN